MATKGKEADPQTGPASTGKVSAAKKPATKRSARKKTAAPAVEEVLAELPVLTAAGRRKARRKQAKKNANRGMSIGQPGRNGRHAKAKRPTTPESAVIAERRALVWGLTKAKKSVRTISAYLKKKGFRASVGTIQDDREWCFENARGELMIDVKDELITALAVLDDLQGTFYTKAIRDEDKDASAEVRLILKERDRLTNYSKAQQKDLELKTKLIEFLGFDPEDPTHVDSDGDKV